MPALYSTCSVLAFFMILMNRENGATHMQADKAFIGQRHNTEPEFFNILRSPRIDSQEPIPPGFVAWRAGTTTLYSVPSPHRLFKNSSTVQ